MQPRLEPLDTVPVKFKPQPFGYGLFSLSHEHVMFRLESKMRAKRKTQ